MPSEHENLLTDIQLDRYQRQIILSCAGREGQKKVLTAKVLVMGLGGLGSPVAMYLAGAGVGQIGLVDSGQVELSNLHRQILYTADDIGKDKTAVGQKRLSAVNRDVTFVSYQYHVDAKNIRDMVKEYDIVVDCSDNFPTRFLVNDVCAELSRPLVHGSVLGLEGQVLTILPGEGPCYRCLFPEAPAPGLLPTPAEVGILAPIAGIIGAIQANEVLKLILGIGTSLSGKLTVFNLLDSSCRQFGVVKNAHCPACSSR